MLHLLPVEIALHALSCLPLQSLYRVSLVSRSWNSLVTNNEPAVYRNVAILHHFIDETQIRACSDPDDWKAYCRKQLEIERGWRGKAPSVIRELTATGSTVHRIKVDYELGLVITTSQLGGLFVCDIESNCVLWALLPHHTVRYAHCEYDRGYIIINRFDHCKEVWRRAADTDGDQPDRTSPPDKQMLDASVQALSRFRSTDSYRGHFKPWALIHMPDDTRAFRFSYPTLLAASVNNAYVWDVPGSRLISSIMDIQRQSQGQQFAPIKYVEVNDLYVFICSGSTLRIFSRDGGASLYQVSVRELSCATWEVLPQGRPSGAPSSIVNPQMLLHRHSPSSFHGDFVACHVSASGDDLTVLTSNGRLVIFPRFQRLFSESNAVHHRDMAVVLDFQPVSSIEDISYYLAVGGQNGKFALATRKGIFIVSLDFELNRLTAERPADPGVSVCRLSYFDKASLLSLITCLQMTHDALYFTYKPSYASTAARARAEHHWHPIGVDDISDAETSSDGDDIENGFQDEWDDEFDDDELVGVPGEIEDPIVVNNWLFPTISNTVYSVKF